MHLVLTGSESFIGTELKKQCKIRGFRVTGLDVVPLQRPDYYQMDIRSPEIAQAIPEGAEALIHLAAISRDQDCLRDLRTAFDVNVSGTINLMRAAQLRGVKQFIFASSEWVYGNARDGEVQTEDSVIDANRAQSEYALTKIVGERLLFMAYRRGLCPVTALRFGIVYGPRPKPMSAVEGLFQEVGTLETVEIKGSLSSGRRFIHVSDIAQGILSVLGRTGCEIFNLSGDRVYTFREIIQESMRLQGRNPKVIETDPTAINIRNPDNQKAKRELGWAPKIDIGQGLATLMAFQQKKV